MSRRDDMAREAAELGLLCTWWSPGDGVTRYRFFRRDDVPASQTYFGPKYGLHTALGAQKARQFLAGYRSARETA